MLNLHILKFFLYNKKLLIEFDSYDLNLFAVINIIKNKK